MGLLELKLLGPPEVRHGDREVDFRTSKALAMLAYMCLEPGLHAREHLAALLWPESESGPARANLRSTLMYLRKPLRHPNERQDNPHLHVNRQALGFNFDADYRLDLGLWSGLPAEPTPETVEELLEVSRGEFMQGFSVANAGPFEEWLRAQRERWRVDLAGHFDRLTLQMRERNRGSLAQRAALRWTELDPFNEAAYRRLMRTTWTDGDRSGALRAYERLCHLLDEELDLEPAPETQALAARIRRSGAPEGETDRAQAQFQKPPLARLPFVGREAAHSQLVRAYHAARLDGGRAAIVEGEAGIGKTRLAHEFLSWARSEKAEVLQARASEAGSPLPYQPLVEALRPALPRATKSPEGLDEVWLRELARVFPEVQEARPDLEVPAADPPRTVRLYESVFRLTASLAQDSTLVLFVDDLQWAGSGTLELLAYLSRRWVEETTKALFLTCMRPEGLPVAGPGGRDSISAWRRSLGRDVPMDRVTLNRLSESEVRSLMRRVLRAGGETSAAHTALVEWVIEETEGHPFYLTETLKTLADQGVLITTQRGEMGHRLHLSPELLKGDLKEQLKARELLPHGVREVVRGRLDGLPTEAAELLAAGAVLGDGFEFDLAREIAELDETPALRALDVIQAASLWSVEGETGTGSPEFAFVHDKIRDVVYTDAGPFRRRLYHRRAFELLQERDAPEAELARHAYEAGLMEQAFRLWLDAGRAAFDISAVRAAVSRYETARQILNEQAQVAEAVDPESTRKLYQDLGRAYELLNDWEAARAVYGELLEIGRERGRVDLEAKALIGLSGVHLLEASDLGAAEEHLAQAIEAAREAQDRHVEAEAEAQLAQLHHIQFQRARATDHAQRAVALAEAMGAQAHLARSLNVLSYAAAIERPAEEVESIAERARRIYRELGDRAMEIDCAVRVATLRQFAGRSGEARPLLEESVEASREIQNEWGLMNGLNHLASVMMDLGRLGEALAAAEESVEIARASSGVPILVNSLSVLGFVYRELGRPREAAEVHREAENATGRLAPENFGPGLAAQLCADYVALEEWDLAAEAAERSLRAIDYAWVHRAEADPWLLEVLLRSGEEVRASEVSARLASAAEGNPRLRLPLCRCEARLALARDEPQAAVDILQEGLSLAESMELKWLRWTLLTECSAALRGAGSEQAAQEAHEQAVDLVMEMAGTLPGETGRKLLHNPWQTEVLGSTKRTSH